jgi:transcriptional regulator
LYIPRANEEQRVPVMHDLIRSQPFGTLITMTASGLFASHIPMVLEDDGSPFGVLKAHVSRANTQWREHSADVEALAIFAGHHHYISASWYPGAKETGAEVPTWNYVVVHATGPLRAIEDKQWLLAHLTSLTNIHEAASQEPWKVSDAPETYLNSQIKGIVGLELPIRRLEGKWKVSQNRNERDRSAVIQGLTNLNTEDSLAMVTLIENSRKV